VSFLLFAAICWVLPIAVGHKIGQEKQRAGWAWGLLLGWLGVIILACLGPAKSVTAHHSFQLSSGRQALPATVHAPPPTVPAAGWYADPHQPQMVRYWDGAGWTGSVAPTAAV
jgi:hypothetical protein